MLTIVRVIQRAVHPRGPEGTVGLTNDSANKVEQVGANGSRAFGKVARKQSATSIPAAATGSLTGELVRLSTWDEGRLVEHIQHNHDCAAQQLESFLFHAYQVGLALLAARRCAPHGQWENWVELRCNFSAQTAWRYMRIAEGYEQLPPTVTSLRQAIKHISTSADQRDRSKRKGQTGKHKSAPNTEAKNLVTVLEWVHVLEVLESIVTRLPQLPDEVPDDEQRAVLDARLGECLYRFRAVRESFTRERFEG